jgi:hypothetical protein
MESTWAGDYSEDPLPYWGDANRKPYLLHWAGTKPDGSRPVDELFLEHLTIKEREQWKIQLSTKAAGKTSLQGKFKHRVRLVWKALTDKL